VSIDIENETEGKAALVVIDVEPDFQQKGIIRVTRQSLQECSPSTTRGACLTQVSPFSVVEREARVVVDLASIELEPYEDPPLYKSPYYR
jgi:hypothetical protein